MINTSKLGTLVYLHTLDAHIMYDLKLTGNWNHIYISYLPAIEYTYLNLDVEATICQSLIGYGPADLTVHPLPQNCRGWVHFFCIGV